MLFAVGDRKGAGATLAMLLAAVAAGAQTLPLRTEEATTAPAGRIVFETGFEAMAAVPNYITGLERTAWAGPLLRCVYSPAGNVEVDLDWVARVGAAHEAGQPVGSAWGDVTLRAKVRFAKGAGRHPTLGARPEALYVSGAQRPRYQTRTGRRGALYRVLLQP